MSVEPRIVLRSSWLASFALSAPVAVVFLAVQFWAGSFAGAVTVLVVISAVTATTRLVTCVELTAHGLGIRWFAMTVVPWQQIRSVETVGRYGGSELYAVDLVTNRRRRLPAPRGAFGVGNQQVAEARDVIEQWWLAYRGSPPPMPAPPDAVSGPPLDPYRPPVEG